MTSISKISLLSKIFATIKLKMTHNVIYSASIKTTHLCVRTYTRLRLYPYINGMLTNEDLKYTYCGFTAPEHASEAW